MEDHLEEISIYDLPTRRFYYSLTHMLSDMHQNERGRLIYSNIYPCLNSYHSESLALLRATAKLISTISEQEQHFETDYLAKRMKVKEFIEKEEEEEERESLNILESRLLERKLIFYEDLDLEKNLFLLGAIVQFLSSFESTLHSLYKKITEIDAQLPRIESICKRDKGIIKYLKYFEKALVPDAVGGLIGGAFYQKLCQWIDFRNNIVHNNNEATEELKEIVKQRRLNIPDIRGKFIFYESNIRDIASICGEILDILIEKVLRPYFVDSGALKLDGN